MERETFSYLRLVDMTGCWSEGVKMLNISSDFEIIAAVLAIFKYYHYICSSMTARASRRTAHP
jgi:hypothetical protein